MSPRIITPQQRRRLLIWWERSPNAYSGYRNSALEVIAAICEEEMFTNMKRCALEIRPALLENDRAEEKDKKTIPLANQLLEAAEE